MPWSPRPGERATAAEARAQQRAAARGWAAGEAAAVREAAEAEVARAYATADEAVQKAQARATRTLSMPVPPLDFRSETAHIENALNALHQIDYMLEVGMADEGDDDIPVDVDIMQTLARVVHEHAIYLCDEAKDGTDVVHRNEETAAYCRGCRRGFSWVSAAHRDCRPAAGHPP